MRMGTKKNLPQQHIISVHPTYLFLFSSLAASKIEVLKLKDVVHCGALETCFMAREGSRGLVLRAPRRMISTTMLAVAEVRCSSGSGVLMKDGQAPKTTHLVEISMK